MPRCVICYSPCRLTDDGKFYACPCGCSRFRVSEVQRMEQLCRESDNYAAYGHLARSDDTTIGRIGEFSARGTEVGTFGFLARG